MYISPPQGQKNCSDIKQTSEALLIYFNNYENLCCIWLDASLFWHFH